MKAVPCLQATLSADAPDREWRDRGEPEGPSGQALWLQLHSGGREDH